MNEPSKPIYVVSKSEPNDEDEQCEYLEYLEDYSADVMSSSVTTYPASLLATRNRFCRLCLQKSESFLLPLSAKIEHITVTEMLLMVTGLEMETSPLFPTKICTNCMTKLDFAFNVRQEFLNSLELLLKMAVEERLPAYYAQYEDDGGRLEAKEGGRTYTDEILKSSRNILETKIELDVRHGCAKEENSMKESVEFESEVGIDEVEVSEDLTDEPPVVEEKNSVPEKEEKYLVPDKEPKKEKFVYSWKELVKPKSKKKKPKPENALSGIHKAKADAELLAQFPQTTCYICDTPHDTLEARDEHLDSHVDMVPHRCESCSTEGESIVSKSVITLNRHRLMHQLPYKCNFCFRRFISSGSQYTHTWSMHMTDTEGMTCDYCGKIFTQKRSFQAHVRRHRYKANGKYRCNTCGETCGSNILLVRHQRKHTGEKNFTCPFCSKAFSRACNLLAHKRIHTNERCHKCDDCGTTFRDSVTLRKHRDRFHLGKTPTLKVDRNPYVVTEDGRKLFQCKYDGCKYETYGSTSISRHKARHVKRYCCGECGKRFAEPNLVRRHQASMHSGKTRTRMTKPRETSGKRVKAEQDAEDGEVLQEDEIVEMVDFEEEGCEQTLKAEPEYEIEVVEETIDVV